MDTKDALVIFEGNKIRRIWHNDEWFFSVIDIIAALTDSLRPRKHWSDLKKKLEQDEGFELYEKIGQLKIEAYENIVRLKMAQKTEHRAFSVNTGRRYE